MFCMVPRGAIYCRYQDFGACQGGRLWGKQQKDKKQNQKYCRSGRFQSFYYKTVCFIQFEVIYDTLCAIIAPLIAIELKAPFMWCDWAVGYF